MGVTLTNIIFSSFLRNVPAFLPGPRGKPSSCSSTSARWAIGKITAPDPWHNFGYLHHTESRELDQ